MFGLFNSNQSDRYSDGLGADDGAWSVARSDRTVRSVEPVKGFKEVSERDLTAFSQKLKERQAMSKRWSKWLQLHGAWEQIDANDTKELQGYFAELVKSLTEKRAAIGAKRVALEKNRVIQARITNGVADARTDADQAIAELRNKQSQIAKGRGWNR